MKHLILIIFVFMFLGCVQRGHVKVMTVTEYTAKVQKVQKKIQNENKEIKEFLES